MHGFYVGAFFIADHSLPVQQDWLFPDNLEHSRDTSNVEDLRINPEDIELIPMEVQAGAASYTRIAFSTIPDFYTGDSGAIEDFYFTLFPDLGFYFRDLPGLGGFYDAGTEVSDFYAIVPAGTGGFYVNEDNVVDFYNAVPPGLGGFYIPNDFNTDGFYVALVGN